MTDFPSGTYEILELKSEKYKPNKTYTININTEEKRINGVFDCNTYSCNYEKEDQNIDFGFAMATKMYCKGEMNNEDAFFGKLNSLKSYGYVDDILTFYDENEKMILKLKRQKS